jgi:hypothetical protein
MKTRAHANIFKDFKPIYFLLKLNGLAPFSYENGNFRTTFLDGFFALIVASLHTLVFIMIIRSEKIFNVTSRTKFLNISMVIGFLITIVTRAFGNMYMYVIKLDFVKFLEILQDFDEQVDNLISFFYGTVLYFQIIFKPVVGCQPRKHQKSFYLKFILKFTILMFCDYLISAFYVVVDMNVSYELQVFNFVAFLYVWLIMIYNLMIHF